MPQVDVETLIPDEAAQRIIAVADADPMIAALSPHLNPRETAGAAKNNFGVPPPECKPTPTRNNPFGDVFGAGAKNDLLRRPIPH